MYCKHCGKEISENAKFCDSCGNPLSDACTPFEGNIGHKKKSKKRHPILGTILFIIGIFIFIGAFSGSSDEPKKINTSSQPATTVSVTEEAFFTVGDTLEMNNIIVTLNDVSEKYGSQFLKPTDGNVFVICEFTIENNTESDLVVSSIMSFECYFDDFASNFSLGAMTSNQNKTQLDGTVAHGKKISGIVGYEAPENWSTMEVHFKPGLSSKPFVFIYSK
jgi:hypothetical protein